MYNFGQKIKGRILSYSRISTDLQSEISVQAQKFRIRSYAKSLGYEDNEIIEYDDIGISGKTSKRPGLQKLLDEAKEYDTCIVYSLSRFSRSLKQTLEWVEEFKKRKIKFISLTENFDLESPSGIMFSSILAVLNSYESDLTAQRTSNSMRMLIKQGRLKRKPEWGFKFVAKGIPFEPCERELEISKYICKMWDEGLTATQILQRLRFENIKSRQKKDGNWTEFYLPLVQKILKLNNKC